MCDLWSFWAVSLGHVISTSDTNWRFGRKKGCGVDKNGADGIPQPPFLTTSHLQEKGKRLAEQSPCQPTSEARDAARKDSGSQSRAGSGVWLVSRTRPSCFALIHVVVVIRKAHCALPQTGLQMDSTCLLSLRLDCRAVVVSLLCARRTRRCW